MIIGEVRKELTAENILKIITEYDIYKHFFGDFQINTVTTNHLRGDHTPSFIIGNVTGHLTHYDFADAIWRGDCFSLVMQMHGCDFHSALRIIDKAFGLGFTGENVGEYKKIVSVYKQPEELKEKHYSIIQVVTRKFNSEELSYWNSYFQSEEDLRKHHVYAIKSLFLNRKRFPLSNCSLHFGYLYDDKWKIYSPQETKKKKWISNVPITVMDGKEYITNCDIAFINKSKKDFLVMRKVFDCSCAVQNESIGCFSDENVEFLKANSNRQILSFDSDQPGVTNSQQITKLFNFDYCNVPRKYLTEGIKDWADLGKYHGLKVIEDYLKEKKVIL